MDLKGRSLEDLAYEVCTAFRRVNVVAVLVGGGAAAFYAPRAYETRDLDFVLPFELFGMPKVTVITDLGFAPTNTAGTYAHADTPYTLEILRGPLGIGEEVINTYDTLYKGASVLHIISPLNSVKDRLAHAIHFHDLNATRQAAELAKLHDIDFDAVRSWCKAEGGLSTFEVFERFHGM